MTASLSTMLAGPVGEGEIRVSSVPAVNVATVPQRSPLRYPGGKTWLIPHIRQWLGSSAPPVRLLIEPFAGGGIVSLTAVMEGLADRCLVAEIDHDVSAFWHAALRHGDELCDLVMAFRATREAVKDLEASCPNSVLEHGFRTLVLNRTRRGGILAPGASLAKVGENGRGIASRWYPTTIVSRLRKITKFASRITFCETDGVRLLESLTNNLNDGVAVFADPPYTAEGKQAGKRLYAHNEIDHSRVFNALAESASDFLITYDKSPEIISLTHQHGFHAVQVTMTNTHHAQIPELVISRRRMF